MIDHARRALESVGLTAAAGRTLSRPSRSIRTVLRTIDPAIRAMSRHPIPSPSLCYEGPPFAVHYLVNGWEYAVYLKRFGLTPDSAVLDIGCGVGRKAWSIIRELSDVGLYRGIDIVPEAIAWCTHELATSDGRVRFEMIDVHNQYYHPAGTGLARDYRFPFADASFDVILSSSVYTHMLPLDVATYLRESRRVAASDARLVSSFFVLDRTSEENIRLGRSVYTFAYKHGDCRVEHESCPEHVVAYDQEYLEELFDLSGLTIVTHLPGRWSGRRGGYAYQDLYVLALTTGPVETDS